MMTLRDKLIHAVTAYDIKQATKRGHNPYALGIYFERIDAVCDDIDRGKPVRAALLAGFNDRLLDVCLVAAGLTKFTLEEKQNGAMSYTSTADTGVA